ncbi:hypothetical protein HYH03_018967 [Edaphochlamys debaryana]|uniref:Uncharacterized protein n=1 Tax=Edaphochlamys debaryana TaxID=47281 RepID=A0A835XJ49_9CHLO|nr:hypothetical protein HYH03_018967 [Edaphochlamys debaryana]|eukprot:KAG2482075.1 hypothetical protein HYH03_018967 [Edaphochlamys debaryana]
MPLGRRPLKSLKTQHGARSAENDWKGLLELGGRLLRLRGSGPRLRIAEAESLEERLQRLVDWTRGREDAGDEESVAEALPGQMLALLRLQAWAARLHPDPKDTAESKLLQSVAATAGVLVPKVLRAAHRGWRPDISPASGWASGAVIPTVGFCRALLRTQALRAAAVDLSQWLQKLEAGARAALRRSGPQQHLRKAVATGHLGLDNVHSASALRSAVDLVDAISFVAATSSSDSSSCSHQGSAAGPSQQPAPLSAELIAELEATAMMEHAARLLLQQGRVVELLEAEAAGGGGAAGAAGAGGSRKADTRSVVSAYASHLLHAYSALSLLLEHMAFVPAGEAGPASAAVAEAAEAAAAAASGGGGPECGGYADEGTDAGSGPGGRGDGNADRGAVMSLARTLRRVMQGHAVQFAVLSYGICTLRVADGGPTYGLADAELAWVRPLSSEPAEGDGGRRHVIDAGLLAALLTTLIVPHAIRSPPITARAAAALALRLGRIALATARGFGALAPPSVPSPDDPALVLPTGHWSNTLSTVLTVCAGLQDEYGTLEAPAGARPRLFRRRGWAAEADATWRLWVDVLRWAVPRGMERGDVESVVRQGLRMQADVLDELWLTEDASALPAEAPPELAAALRAGWLPALELVLVRTCTEDEPGPYSAVLMNLCAEQPESFAWQTFTMLSYGELSQGADVVAALGAVLRRLNRDLDLNLDLESCSSSGGSSGGSSSSGSGSGSPQQHRRPGPCLELISAEACPGEDVQHAALLLAALLLRMSPSALHVAQGPPPVRRRSLLTSLAALEWLPPLSQLARVAVLRGPPGEASCILGHMMPAMLLWIAALAAHGAQPAAPATAAPAAAPDTAAPAAAPDTAPGPGPCSEASGPAASVSVSWSSSSSSSSPGSSTTSLRNPNKAPRTASATATATAASGSGSGSGISDWQQFLLEEVGAVQVVGAALVAAEKWLGGSGGGGCFSSVADSAGASDGGGRSSSGSETGSGSAGGGAGAGSTASRSASGISKAGGEDGAEAAEVQEEVTVLPFAAAVIHLARLPPVRRLLGPAGAGSGSRLPWRPEALRVLRRALEAECACGQQDGAERACGQQDGAERAGGQEDGEPSSNQQEDGATCGAALEQLAVCLEAARPGAGGSGGAAEVEGLGVSAAVLEAAARAVDRLLGERTWLPAVQPLAEVRALRPHSAAAAIAASAGLG